MRINPLFGDCGGRARVRPVPEKAGNSRCDGPVDDDENDANRYALAIGLWHRARQASADGCDGRAVTSWALAVRMDWNRLQTRQEGRAGPRLLQIPRFGLLYCPPLVPQDGFSGIAGSSRGDTHIFTNPSLGTAWSGPTYKDAHSPRKTLPTSSRSSRNASWIKSNVSRCRPSKYMECTSSRPAP